jgi:hypothetical protein
LCEETPVKSASFATHVRPEKKLAASLAESIGFEPRVAVRCLHRANGLAGCNGDVGARSCTF